MAAEGERARAPVGPVLVGPVLVGRRVRLRPGRPGDAQRLHAILAEPSVSRWWADPDPVTVIEDDLRGSGGRFHDGLLMDLLRDELRCAP
jgi:hypothetical protein